jgi:hypothetical protein
MAETADPRARRPPGPAAGLPPLPEPRLDRTTGPLLAACFGSGAGSLALVTALGKQVYDLSGRELDLGLVGLAEFVPAALLVLVTGAVADRFDRRTVGALSLVAEAGAALLLVAYTATRPTAVGPLFGVAVAFGVGRAFGAPSIRSLPADAVPPEHLPWLIPRWSITFQVALIVGPVLAGSLYALDVRAPYLAAAVLFLGAAVSVRLVRIDGPHPAAGPPAGAPAPADTADTTGALPAPGAGPREGAADAAGALPAPDAGPPEGTTDPVGTPGAGVPEDAAGADARPGLRDALDGLRFVRRQPILFGPSRSTCSPSCSAGPSPCSRRSPRSASGWAPSGSAGSGPPPASGRRA